jgi:general transcriptional corepressor TUP1
MEQTMTSQQSTARLPPLPAPAFSLLDQDLDSIPADFKCQGEDWFAISNNNVPRQFDVSLLHTFEHNSVVPSIQFSADGKYVATGCNRTAQIFDVKTGQKTSTFSDETTDPGDMYIRAVCFSPDGQSLATGGQDRIIRIWDIAQGKIRNTLIGHEQDIYTLSWSPDGRRIASGSGDRTVRLWDVETGQCLFDFATGDGATSVAFSPDGRFLAAGSLDRSVRLWDTEMGSLVEKLDGHTDSVYSVAFSPDGHHLLSGSLDKTVKLWELNARPEAGLTQASLPKAGVCKRTFIGHKEFVLSVVMTPDGNWVVSASKDRSVRFWDPVDGQTQFVVQAHNNSGTCKYPRSWHDTNASLDSHCSCSCSDWSREAICNGKWRLQSSNLEL